MTQPFQEDVTCTNCGTSNRAGARFCRKCGAALPATEVQLTLPSAPTPSPRDVPPAPVPAASGSGNQAELAQPARRLPVRLLAAIAGLVLLFVLACLAGRLYFSTIGRPQTLAPAVTTEATNTGASVSLPTEAPTADAATAEPTSAVEPAATATVEAAATVANLPAVTATVATAEPTPEPLVELTPQPGTLGLPDYQATVGAYTQRLFETFDRGERTKAIWSQFDNESVAARLRNNFYALTVKGADKNMWETWDTDLGSEYNIELSVAFETTGAPSTIGVAFDVQPDGDNGMFFEIFNDRRWQLRTVQDGRLVRELTTGIIELPELQDGVGTNVLWVVRKPDQVQLWVNSMHVATLPASPFPGGRAGVIASSRAGLSGDATMIADNFRVRTP